MQTSEMMKTWVKGTGKISATRMLFFSLFRMSIPHPNPEGELLDLFTTAPGTGDTWPVCNKYLLNA